MPVPCYHPLTAWQTIDGTIAFKSGCGRKLQLPCGRCVGCRLERSRQWAVRCMHEASLHEHNAFISLTYDPQWQEHSLCPDDFTNFLKRARHKLGPFRYYMAGEYSELNKLPHFHACLFGAHFKDKYYFKNSPSGMKLYRSPTLEKLWPFGYSSIGDVTFESAAYVARYVMKKQTGENTKNHYERIDARTGEIFSIRPEYNRMSLKPGIGKNWISKYINDVYPRDKVRVNNHDAKPPRYYDKHLETVLLPEYAELKLEREHKARLQRKDNTEERLRDKEKVAYAKLQLKKRGKT